MADKAPRNVKKVLKLKAKSANRKLWSRDTRMLPATDKLQSDENPQKAQTNTRPVRKCKSSRIIPNSFNTITDSALTRDDLVQSNNNNIKVCEISCKSVSGLSSQNPISSS
eukprot:334108_1